MVGENAVRAHRNFRCRRVFGRAMTVRGIYFAGVILLAVVLLMSAPAPALAARVGIFVGGPGWGYPGWGYPAPYSYYPYYYPPYPPPVYGPPAVPPPGWAPGRWEWRSDPWGRRYPVWVPAHLR